jgi:hypothetical protein
LSLNKYGLYGLTLISGEVLPGLFLKNSHNPVKEIEIKFIAEKPDLNLFSAKSTIMLKAPLKNLKQAQLLIGGQDFNFSLQYIYENSGSMYTLSKNGNNLKINYYPASDLETIVNLLYHPVMAYVARLNGRICLHANVILINGKAVAFLGESGAGKSTLSTYLCKTGHQVFSDDVCALTEESGLYNVWPGQPRLRINLKTLEEICGTDIESEVVFISERKAENPKVYFGKLPDNKTENAPVQLDAIYILGARRKELTLPVISKPESTEAVKLLLSNRSATEIMEPQDRAREFSFLCGLVKQVKVKKIECPDNLTLLNVTTDSIIKDLKL